MIPDRFQVPSEGKTTLKYKDLTDSERHAFQAIPDVWIRPYGDGWEVSYPTTPPCPACKGTGCIKSAGPSGTDHRVAYWEEHTCDACGGTGNGASLADKVRYATISQAVSKVASQVQNRIAAALQQELSRELPLFDRRQRRTLILASLMGAASLLLALIGLGSYSGYLSLLIVFLLACSGGMASGVRTLSSVRGKKYSPSFVLPRSRKISFGDLLWVTLPAALVVIHTQTSPNEQWISWLSCISVCALFVWHIASWITMSCSIDLAERLQKLK